MERESNNPHYSFLFYSPSTTNSSSSSPSAEHLYYRWKVFSLSQHDSADHWRTTPFQIQALGAFFVPPDPVQERAKEKELARREDEMRRRAEGEAHVEAQTREEERGFKTNKQILSEHESSILMELLRGVTTQRSSVRECMAFCLDHSEQSKEVVEIIAESLTLNETPIQKKLAR